MDTGIVEHHNVGLGPDLRTESVEECDHIALSGWLLNRRPDQGMVLIRSPQYINALPMRLRLNGMRLTARRPAVGNWRIRTEAGFVKKQQAAQPLPGQFS
jgi:hypothetical protein